MEDDLQFNVVRGKRIEEFRHQDLLELHRQIDSELPQEIGQLTESHAKQLLELELIEDELERRHEQSA